ncbi:hypothetical protein LIER_00596 [Lithospermum erythrorhizon]|uniref:Uncharacterized protein n=1 Tax=Lithospermum erythrorhizon TaxID=34254 RepID=A0AAV3NLN0_LITER
MMTKPRESMVPEATSTSPPLTNNVPIPAINPLLINMLTTSPSVPPPSKKTKKTAPSKKKVTQVLLVILQMRSRQHNKFSQALGLWQLLQTLWPWIPPQLFLTMQADLEEKLRSSKEKVIRKNQWEASASTPPLPKYSSLYLAKPYAVPNLEVTSESLWGARKFHFHLARPLLSKEMVAQYTRLADPYAAFTQIMKHINQRLCVSEASRPPGLDNSSLRYKMEGMKKTISFKNNLNLGLDKEYKDQKAKLEEEDKDAAKAWSIEKAQLEAEMDNLRVEKKAFQVRNEELEQAKKNEAIKASEVLTQVKKDAEIALASTVAKAETTRINFVNSTLRSFLSSRAYDKKVGSECEAYLHPLVSSTQGRFPDLVSLFNEEVIRRPDW